MKAKVKTWLKNLENGTIKTNTEIVLKAVKENTPECNIFDFTNEKKGVSTYELRNILNMSHQTLTSRLSDLQDEGLIKDVSQVTVDGTVYSVYMFIKHLEYRKQLITSRKKEKYIQWLKNADKYFEFMDSRTSNLICFEQEKNNF